MSKKVIIIFIIIIVTAIFGWIFLVPKEKSPISQEIVEFPINIETRDASTQKSTENKPRFTIFTFPESQKSKPQNYVTEKELPFLEPELGSLQNFDAVIEEISPVFNNDKDQQNIEEITSPKEPNQLTEAEIEKKVFDRLYPDYFVNGLAFTENVFIEQDFLETSYEKIEMFNTEEKIFAFVNTIIDVFEQQGFYTNEEADKFRLGANKTWKSLLKSEKKLFREEFLSSELSKRIAANIFYQIRKQTSKKIIGIIKNIEQITAKEVRAADCFRSGGGSGIGSNVSAPCCNCGLKFDSNGNPRPVKDCGSGSRGCDVPLGCKNLYGKGRPVIWDSSTGICGVG